MKTTHATNLLGIIFIGLLSLPGNLFAVSVSVSPNAISDDYTGTVSVNITGLTVGKTVLVERFIDVDGDGAIDPGRDLLTFSTKVIDGQLPFIGGVRNANVPGDDDGVADGAIRMDLPFPGVDNVFSIVAAKSIFRVSDPQNGFTSVTTIFQVTQHVQSQGVSGQVTAASGAPMPGALVALSPVFGRSVAATLTDANGNYTLATKPGFFRLEVLQNGFVTDENAGGVTVQAGQFATQNLSLISAGFTLSGKVSDNSSGAGIAGVFIGGESGNGFFCGGLTDSSGNYTFAVTADKWQIKTSEDQLAQIGYLRPQKVTIITPASGATTINFGAPRATALIYGTVTDGANIPVNGLGISAGSQGDLYDANGTTFFPNGNYVVGARAGTWQVGPDADDLAALGYVGGAYSDLSLTAGQAVAANFVVQPVTAHLRGQIKDDAGAPIPNMSIVVRDLKGGPINFGTDSNGNFDAGVRGGSWEIDLECTSAQSRGYIDASGNQFFVTDGVDQNNILLTFPTFTATISGSVMDDTGHPIPGVELDASQPVGNSSYDPGCVSTDNNGNYTIKVLSGTWTVSVRSEDLNARGFNGVIDQSVTLSGTTGSANFIARPVLPEIISPTSATGTVGQQFIYQFETRFPASLAVTNLPAGLTFMPGISAIVGVPISAGVFPVGLSASNSSGTTTATLNLTVQPAPTGGPIIMSSTSATGRVGQPFTFRVLTTGGTSAARLSTTGLPDGLSADAVSGVISGTPTEEGSFPVTLTVTDGALAATAVLQLTFTSNPAVPVIVSPNTASLAVGEPFSYTIEAPSSADPVSDPTVFALVGTLPAGLSFDPVNGIISGSYSPRPGGGGGRTDAPELAGGALLGRVQLFGTNSQGSGTFQLLFLAAPSGLVNISTRMLVGGEDNVLIGGFIVAGNAPKVLITRAMGPSLAAAGIPGVLQDPALELHDGLHPDQIIFNDNWKNDQEQVIRDTAIQPIDNHESAIVAGLDPGNYTAIVRGKDNTTGVAVVEVYDLGTASLDASSGARLAQISTRGTVLTDDNVMIGGFIIRGAATQVIMRAIGPELNGVVPGALQDTVLELRDGSGSLITSNDDWRSTQEQEIIATGVPPGDDRESAIVATLNPGAYTGIVSGRNSSTGVALVEVYWLQ